MSAKTILTVEDDEPIRRGVVDALKYAGFRVIEAGDGNRGLHLATTCDYDLLLLDLVLPGASGLDILRAVRRGRPTQPIIILSARGEEQDRVDGLELGADDYVVKPFSVKELLARVEAVMRRSPSRPTDVDSVKFTGGLVDLSRCEVRFADGERADLSQKEADLLRYLACHRGRAIARDELLAHVWQITPQGISTRTIDMHIARLRDKLRDDPADPQIVLTVRGKGYMLATGDTAVT
jgi:DNA-binding response OmpR family regulator